jgi:hypothetical protein
MDTSKEYIKMCERATKYLPVKEDYADGDMYIK